MVNSNLVFISKVIRLLNFSSQVNNEMKLKAKGNVFCIVNVKTDFDNRSLKNCLIDKNFKIISERKNIIEFS